MRVAGHVRDDVLLAHALQRVAEDGLKAGGVLFAEEETKRQGQGQVAKGVCRRAVLS